MEKILVDIPYLEEADVNADGTLKPHITNGKPVVLMLQGDFCGYCTQAKPEFQRLRQRARDFSCATIQIDGPPSDRKANAVVSKVVQTQGVPAFLGFNRQGRFASMYNGPRTADGLEAFAQSLQ